MYQIAHDILIVALLAMGWLPSEATNIVSLHPAYWNTRLPYGWAYYYSTTKHIEFYSPYAQPETIDHEFQHAWHDDRGIIGSTVEPDFIDWCASGTADYVCHIMAEFPGDPAHWPFYVLTYHNRQVSRIPQPYRSKYYGWHKAQYQVAVPYIPVGAQ